MSAERGTRSGLAGRRVLLTGATGFVGGHLAARLAGLGATVLGMGPETAPRAGAGAELSGWWQADLRDPAALGDAVAAAAPDALVHLAAQSSAARSFEAPAETFEINTLGTWRLLEAVRAHAPAARVLAVGTSEVYGPQPPGTRAAEDTPFRPVSPYALSKAAADSAAEIAAQRWGLDIVRTRSFPHTGPGQTTTFVVPSFARQVAEIEAGRREPVLSVGNLDVVRDLTDVRDVADAYAGLLLRGVPGGAYNVCRGEPVHLRALLDALLARCGVAIRVEVDPARLRPADVPYLVGDPRAIARDTGWRAETPLERTLEAVLAEQRAAVAAG